MVDKSVTEQQQINKLTKNSDHYFNAALQTDDFSLDQQYSILKNACPNAGAIVTFTGLVRDVAKTNASVALIELSAYPAMTKAQMHQVGLSVFDHFELDGVNIIHRYGKLKPTEQIVFVGVASKHRSDSFSAAQMIMDQLKSSVAFWKKEHYTDGCESQWIEPTEDDKTALKKWPLKK